MKKRDPGFLIHAMLVAKFYYPSMLLKDTESEYFSHILPT